MVIQDHGKGFHREKLIANNTSFGYKMLEADVYAIGAKLNVQSFPGKGTTVTVSLELKK